MCNSKTVFQNFEKFKEVVSRCKTSGGAKELKKIIIDGGDELLIGLGQISIIWPLLNSFFVISSKKQKRSVFAKIIIDVQKIERELENVNALDYIKSKTTEVADFEFISLYEECVGKLDNDGQIKAQIQLKRTLLAYSTKLFQMTVSHTKFDPSQADNDIVPNNSTAERFFAIFKWIEVNSIFKRVVVLLGKNTGFQSPIITRVQTSGQRFASD